MYGCGEIPDNFIIPYFANKVVRSLEIFCFKFMSSFLKADVFSVKSHLKSARNFKWLEILCEEKKRISWKAPEKMEKGVVSNSHFSLRQTFSESESVNCIAKMYLNKWEDCRLVSGI